MGSDLRTTRVRPNQLARRSLLSARSGDILGEGWRSFMSIDQRLRGSLGQLVSCTTTHRPEPLLKVHYGSLLNGDDRGSMSRWRCNEMSKRLPCPPAPGPLEEYAKSFDHLFA